MRTCEAQTRAQTRRRLGRRLGADYAQTRQQDSDVAPWAAQVHASWLQCYSTMWNGICGATARPPQEEIEDVLRRLQTTRRWYTCGGDRTAPLRLHPSASTRSTDLSRFKTTRTFMDVQKGTSLFQVPRFRDAPPLNNVGPVLPNGMPEKMSARWPGSSRPTLFRGGRGEQNLEKRFHKKEVPFCTRVYNLPVRIPGSS